MLEWDAAQFNEYCTNYSEAMAQFEMTLKQLSKSATPESRREIAELTAKRNELRDEFNKRQYLFWHGEELTE